MIQQVFFILALLFIAPYTLLIIFIVAGWVKTPCCRKQTISQPLPKVSVIVAFRNEAANLPALLSCLSAQQYPLHRLEVLMSDDFSEDHGTDIILKHTTQHPVFQLIRPGNSTHRGKKAALRRALDKARGEIIITTDADCTMDDQWVKNLASPFENNAVQMAMGPVEIINTGSMFSHMQALEFSSLVGTAGGAASWGKPVLCNGANLAFRRKTVQELLPQLPGQKYLSGDDMFMMHAIQKHHPGSIRFVKNRGAMVSTRPAASVKVFFMQRMRWVSKSTGFTDLFTLLTGAIVALSNLFMAISLVLTVVFFQKLLVFVVGLWIIKALVDASLVMPVTNFMGQPRLMRYFPVLSMLYPFYVSTTLAAGFVFPNRWKSRKVNTA